MPLRITKSAAIAGLASALLSSSAFAGENLFGAIKGAEALPAGAKEIYQKINVRSDKDIGDYQAIDYITELEVGMTHRFSYSAAVKLMSLDTSGLIIDGYLPKEKQFDLRTAGLEVKGKYMFLSPAKDDIGLSVSYGLNYGWIDPHSGQDKNTYSFELGMQLQKYFMEGQLIWVGNLGLESTYADRAEIDNLPEDFDWPTDPEMELEPSIGTGISYRFMPNWFASLEAIYETEFETEVGQERWSVFAGPSIHYGSRDWWATFTWLPQLNGGKEQFEGQDPDLHLIEKTKNEYRFNVGFNF